MTSSQTAATTWYWDASVGRLRTCPCAGVPYYRLATGDVLNTDNFALHLGNGINAGSAITVTDAATGAAAWWKIFSTTEFGTSSNYYSTADGQGAVVALTVVPVVV